MGAHPHWHVADEHKYVSERYIVNQAELHVIFRRRMRLFGAPCGPLRTRWCWQIRKY